MEENLFEQRTDLEDLHQSVEELKKEIGKVIVGQEQMIELLLAGDSKKAKEVAKILTLDLGVDQFFDFGGDDAVPLFNEMTSGWRQLLQDHKPKNEGIVRIKR